MTERFGFRVLPLLVISDYGVHEVNVTVSRVHHVLCVRVRPGNLIVPSFSFQWKSDESTKHYLTQILLAINWRYWQAGKKFTHAYQGSKVASCKRASLKSTRFSQKKMYTFLTDFVWSTWKNLLPQHQLRHYDTIAICCWSNIFLCCKRQLYRSHFTPVHWHQKYSQLTNDEKNNEKYSNLKQSQNVGQLMWNW